MLVEFPSDRRNYEVVGFRRINIFLHSHKVRNFFSGVRFFSMDSPPIPKYRELLDLFQVDLSNSELRQHVLIILRFIMNSLSAGVSCKQIRDRTALSESNIKTALKLILVKESPFYLNNKHVYVTNKENWIHKEVIPNTRSAIDEWEERNLRRHFSSEELPKVISNKILYLFKFRKS